MAHIQLNLRAIQEQIRNVTARSVRLVAVSKTKPKEDILAAYEAGQRHFGENYVQELVEKSQQLPKDIQWHFIGSIQSNKIKQLCTIPNLYVIETIDSQKKAIAFNNACSERPSPLQVFIQVNTSGEESKSGVTPKEAVAFAKFLLSECRHLTLAGLMTIGSPSASLHPVNPDFELLVQLKSQIEQETGVQGLELSMGMSDDFLLAIKQGSTNVRVGSSIFGARNYANKS
jgi:pyridoxal phosphate enzyme (YggS family)